MTKIVEIDYTNYRGERAWRTIEPFAESLRFEETEHHRPAQWVFDARDMEKGKIRTFALKDVHGWRPVATASAVPFFASDTGCVVCHQPVCPAGTYCAKHWPDNV